MERSAGVCLVARGLKGEEVRSFVEGRRRVMECIVCEGD